MVEHIYQHNPILKYTQGPLYAPLLPFPYGSLEHTCKRSKGGGVGPMPMMMKLQYALTPLSCSASA